MSTTRLMPWRSRLFAGLGLVVGCVGSPGYPPSNDGGSTATSGSTASGSTAMSASNTQGTVDSSTGLPTEGSSSTGVPPDPFVFADDPAEDYRPVDRVGFPGVNTVLNLLGDKDEYNTSTPVDDAALLFVNGVLDSLNTLHLGAPGMQTPDNTGLDDDLQASSLTPCVAPQLPMDTCDEQALSLALPDVLELDVDDPRGFPNGRMLDEPVMDIILAAVLLDVIELGGSTHYITTFVDLDGDGTIGPSLNPHSNDVTFSDSFPYLAAAHEL